MNAWDWFTLAMFTLAIAPFTALTVLYWRDARRKAEAR